MDASLEREKYEKVWKIPGYADFSPGDHFIRAWMDIARPFDGFRVIDFGCGSGRASNRIASLGFRVVGIDHVDARENPDGWQFVQANLWDKEALEGIRGEYGYCCDVMEHIPPDRVDEVLYQICSRTRWAFFSICLVPDSFGRAIGEPLHLTVQPFEWWKERLSRYGTVREARDCLETGVFYVHSGGTEGLTVTEEEGIENIRHCLTLGLPQLKGGAPQERPVLLLAGGPSLNDHVDEIKAKREDGAALITVNGSHDWALDRGMVPSMQIMVDGRQLNARFVQRPQRETVYALSSHCHADVFAALKGYDVRIFHSGTWPKPEAEILRRYYLGDNFCFIIGGSTVATRGLRVLQTIGLRNIEVYGLDGCHGSAHAYSQPENAGEKVFPVRVGGREFMCSAWQHAQAVHFIDMVKAGLLNEINLTVNGDGLIAHIIRTGAEMNNGSLAEFL